jgi:hypothetical protein
MKTTLNIDDTVTARLRRETARQNKTLFELVEAALGLFQDLPQDKKEEVATTTDVSRW